MTETETIVQTEVITKKQKRVGIYGGTFNPPHLQHLLNAEQVCDELSLDEIWFLPDNIPPHIDEKKAISPFHRIEMVRLAIEGNPKFQLDLTDINRGGVSYTYDTVKIIKEANPDIDFYFIIGGDMVEYLPKWYKIDELVNMIKFVGVARPGYEKKSNYPIIWVSTTLSEINSTDIRNRVKSHKTVRYLIPEKVEKYIKKEGLYLD